MLFLTKLLRSSWVLLRVLRPVARALALLPLRVLLLCNGRSWLGSAALTGVQGPRGQYGTRHGCTSVHRPCSWTLGAGRRLLLGEYGTNKGVNV